MAMAQLMAMARLNVEILQTANPLPNLSPSRTIQRGPQLWPCQQRRPRLQPSPCQQPCPRQPVWRRPGALRRLKTALRLQPSSW